LALRSIFIIDGESIFATSTGAFAVNASPLIMRLDIGLQKSRTFMSCAALQIAQGATRFAA
jgi:hypothetical protein